MSSNIIRIKGAVQYTQLYPCAVCGCEEEGTSQRMEITSPDCLANVKLAPHGMPYGWGSYFVKNITVYKCPHCIASN